MATADPKKKKKKRKKKESLEHKRNRILVALGIYCIKGEFATNPRNSHVDGALAMARSMDPDSAGSQFYFCLGAQHNLDSGYTVFGTTVEGLDVISQLRAGDEIVHVEIVHE